MTGAGMRGKEAVWTFGGAGGHHITENPTRSRTPSVRIVVPPFSSFEALAQKEGGISVLSNTLRLRVPWAIAGLSGTG
jgi:hypothetical protein